MTQKLICDNNFWYRVGEKGIGDVMHELRDCDLYITNLSLVELISSANLTSNFDIVKNAFNAISKYCKIILSQNDAQQLLIIQQIDYVDNIAEVQKKNINRLINSFLNAESIKDLDFDYNHMIESRKKETKDWAVTANEMVLNLRKLKINLEDLRNNSKEILLHHVNRYIERNNIKIESKVFDFSQFELFIECFSLFIQDVISKHDKRIKENDYVDFMNLLYCIGDFKYLTLEKEKGNRIAKMINSTSIGQNYKLHNEDSIKRILNI